MRRHTTLLLTGLAAALLLSLAVNASANIFSLSNKNFRFQWTPLSLTSGAGTIKCPITMEGSFHEQTIAKVEEALIGHISRASVANASCTGGNMTILQEHLPWHLRYSGFTGVLPNITGVILRLAEFTFHFEFSGVPCTTQTTAEHPFRAIAEIASGRNRGLITGLRADETADIPLRGSFLCEIAGTGTFGGTGEVTQLGATSTIRLTLIEGEISEPPTLAPASIDYGTVEPSRTIERTMSVKANGETLTIERISLTTGTSFSISDPNTCRGKRLSPSQECAFTVTFNAPAESGTTRSDTVNVETSVRRLEAEVRGRTSEPPTLEPASIDYGTVEPSRSVERTMSVKANGETLTIERISLRTGTHFSISDPNRCRGARLSPEQTCAFTVTFTAPAESRTTVSDTVNVETSVRRLEAEVRGRTPSSVTLSPSPVRFGTVEPEELAKRTVTITAAERVTINAIKVATGRYFAITDPNDCKGRTIEPEATCAFKVIFVAPGETGRTLRDTIEVETTQGIERDTVEGST